MTAELALERIREAVEIAREVEQETEGNPAAQVGVLRYLLTSCERVLAEADADIRTADVARSVSGGAS